MADQDGLEVESLDLEGQGVARREDGKVVFIEGALPGERVQVQVHRRKAAWEQGVVTVIERESASRVRPRCPHFGLHGGACGGCKMQHLDATAQLAVKQRALEDMLWHIGKVKPDMVARPIEGTPWGYRDRARMSVRHVVKKGTVLVGFHERKSSYVADMQRCEVLAPRASALLMPLRALVMSMEARDRLPQIELAVGGDTVALVLRHLVPLSMGDQAKLSAFAALHRVQWWLQEKGPDTVRPLNPDDAVLQYHLPAFDVTIDFKPTDFTQVNHRVNDVLVSRALQWLALNPNDEVIDWFCGLGNFTLPLARRARQVLGIEGSEALVERSRHNANANGLQSVAQFEAANLFEVTPAWLAQKPDATAWLIDPPREGAMALVKSLAQLRQNTLAEGHAAQDAPWQGPARIVYVSCNPATLARDAGLLVHHAGYHLVQSGVVNMFAHTAHVESMALFVRGPAVPPPAMVDSVADVVADEALPSQADETGVGTP